MDASMALAAQAEALKGEHDKLLATLTAPDRIMSVCEVTTPSRVSAGRFVTDLSRGLRTGARRVHWLT